MGVSFVHTADWHLGGDRYRGKTAKENARKAATAVFDMAIAKKVDLLLIVGDVFSTRETFKEEFEVAMKGARRAKKAGVQIVWVFASHDDVADRRKKYHELPGKHFYGPELKRKTVPALDLTLFGYGRGLEGKDEARKTIRKIEGKRTSKYNIACVHASTKVVTKSFLKKFPKIQYWALGDRHGKELVIDKDHCKAVYPDKHVEGKNARPDSVVVGEILSDGTVEVRWKKLTV